MSPAGTYSELWLLRQSKKQVHTVNSLNSNEKAITIKDCGLFREMLTKDLKTKSDISGICMDVCVCLSVTERE